MTLEKFKTNYPDDATGQIRGDLLDKFGRAMNDLRPPVSTVSRRRTDCDRIVNLSSTALLRFQILQLGDTFNDRGAGTDDISDTLGADGLRPVAYEPCLIGVEPKGRVHEIAVLMESAAVGEEAECQLDGVCTAWVNITSKAHRFAKAIAGSHYLQSAMCGHARIYWSPNATGLQLCRVRLGPPFSVFLWGKTTSSLTAATYDSVNDDDVTPGSGTCEIWSKDFSTGKWKALFDNMVSGDALEETVLNFAPTAIDSGKLIGIFSDDDFILCTGIDFCVDGFA